MENLKKNLHFVVFGAGVLLGVILLVAGITVRGGTESKLDGAQAKLKANTKVPTRGTLKQATERSNKFEGSLKDAESTLSKGAGVSFASNYKTYNAGRAFYTNEADGELRDLKARYQAMEKPLALPKLLVGWEYSTSSKESDFWSPLEREMASPPTDKIRDYQMALRIMGEVATTCERLLATGADGRFGVKLLNMKFDDAYGPSGSSVPDSPWLVKPFSVRLECSPAFAVALLSELVNPSERTLDATAAGKKRAGFPMFVDLMQIEQMARPMVLRFDVSNDEKAAVAKAVNDTLPDGQKIAVPSDPKKMGPKDNGAGQKMVEEIRKALTETDPVTLPVRVGIKLKAAAFNKDWRVVKALEGE